MDVRFERSPAQKGTLAGVAAAVSVAVLCFLYGAVLLMGLLTLPSSRHQIQQPWFTLMEVLILAIAPAMVALTIALHAWAPQQRKPLALASVVFMSLCAGVTCVVHFAVVTLSRQPAFAGEAWARRVFSFQWPSVAYSLDILAWDFFFPLAALSAAATVPGTGLAGAVRRLLYASAFLSFLGLAGVPLADMQVRNAGIIGYVVLFPAAAALLAILWWKTLRKSP